MSGAADGGGVNVLFATLQGDPARDRSGPRMDRLDPRMVPVYRRMSSGQRVQAGLAATEMIRDRLRAHLRGLHPEWDEPRLERAVAERLLAAGDRV
jgi:hypothetical protein